MEISARDVDSAESASNVLCSSPRLSAQTRPRLRYFEYFRTAFLTSEAHMGSNPNLYMLPTELQHHRTFTPPLPHPNTIPQSAQSTHLPLHPRDSPPSQALYLPFYLRYPLDYADSE